MPSSPASLTATRGAPPCVRRPVAMAISGIRLTAVAALGIAVLCLGACTNEPSESEMYQAMIKKTSEMNEEARRQGRAGEVIPDNTKVKKLSAHWPATGPAINVTLKFL